jgi:hypothetical protein
VEAHDQAAKTTVIASTARLPDHFTNFRQRKQAATGITKGDEKAHCLRACRGIDNDTFLLLRGGSVFCPKPPA